MAEKQAVNGSFRRPKGCFSQIANEVLRDQGLSLKAKGLYALVVSYITLPNFVLYKEYLRSQCAEGRFAFDSSWKELTQAGYLKHSRTRQADGTFAYEYLLSLGKESKTKKPTAQSSELLENLKSVAELEFQVGKESKTKKPTAQDRESLGNRQSVSGLYSLLGKESTTEKSMGQGSGLKESGQSLAALEIAFEKKSATSPGKLQRVGEPSLGNHLELDPRGRKETLLFYSFGEEEFYSSYSAEKDGKKNIEVIKGKPRKILQKGSSTEKLEDSLQLVERPVVENQAAVSYIENKSLENKTKSVSETDRLRREQLERQIDWDYFVEDSEISSQQRVVVDSLLDYLCDLGGRKGEGTAVLWGLIESVDSCVMLEFLEHMARKKPNGVRFPVPYWRKAFLNYLEESAFAIAAVASAF